MLELTLDPVFQKAIHVGDLNFDFEHAVAKKKFDGDFMRSVTHYLEEILNQDISILIVGGQMDIKIPHLSFGKTITGMMWKGKAEYEAGERHKWEVDRELAGYAKTGGKLTYALVRNAGHMVIGDQKAWCLDLVRKVTKGLPI
jgi:carboxypeptidase C (cathepsin A)